MKLARLGLYSIISLCCAGSGYSDDISYNYWDVGLALSDQDSEFLSDDLNVFGEINISQNLFQHSTPDNTLGVHLWIDVSQSRDLSNDAAYELTLLQSVVGVGLHYSTDSFSTYFRLGTGGSSAKFKTTSNSSSSSNPIVIGGGGDIFTPPRSIFDEDRPRPQTTQTNEDDGLVGKTGIRYRLFERVQIGAALQWSDMDSMGTEFSTYVQRDFENFPASARTTLNPFGGGYLSLKAEATTDKNKSSIGLSLVYSF